MTTNNHTNSKHNRNVLVLSIITSAMLLSACSGSNESEPLTPVPPPDPVTPPTVNPAKTFAGNLTLGNSGKASNYIRNGLYSMSLGNNQEQVATDAPSAPSFGAIGKGNFSTTNTQEIGVDEADRIEFDGTNIYVADFPIYAYENQQSAQVRILEKQQDSSLIQQSSISLPNNANRINGLYLHKLEGSGESRLAILNMREQPISIDVLPTSSTIFAAESENIDFSINVFNTTNPNSPSQEAEIKIEGYLVDSRRIDNMLYVVSTFIPKLPEIVLNAQDSETQLANYNAIQALSSEELLPKMSINGQIQNVRDIEECYIPENAEPADGFAQTIHVTAIDLSDLQNIQSMCMSAMTEFLYASDKSLYLAGSVDNSTYLHKVSLDGEVNYQASGSVPGVTGFNSQPNLRLSEWNNILRIVTTDYFTNFDDPEHMLFMLGQQGDSLDVLSQLPNEQQPQTLGKPGEDLYAVRYVGNRGYLVTFERIDPLYVLDLSDATAPTILGELEIPGFSSYLQPFDNGLLLGVGQEFSMFRLPENGDLVTTDVPVSEMKISLFDVRDPQNPLEIATIKKANTYTPVEYDYRALSVLSADGLTRFAMPTETWSNDDLSLNASVSNSLLVFDVESSEQQPSLQELFEVTPTPEQQSYVYSGEDRSIITDSGVYYLRRNSLFFRSYDSEEILGPY